MKLRSGKIKSSEHNTLSQTDKVNLTTNLNAFAEIFNQDNNHAKEVLDLVIKTKYPVEHRWLVMEKVHELYEISIPTSIICGTLMLFIANHQETLGDIIDIIGDYKLEYFE